MQNIKWVKCDFLQNKLNVQRTGQRSEQIRPNMKEILPWAALVFLFFKCLCVTQTFYISLQSVGTETCFLYFYVETRMNI